MVVALMGAALAGLVWLGRRFLARSAARTVLRFRARLDRHKLTASRRVKEELLADPEIRTAIATEAERRGDRPSAVESEVYRYVEEIVPFFNVLSYYKLGYGLAKLVTRLFYRVSVEHHDHRALSRIPKGDGVIYLANHRSNMDYVVISYVLAEVVSISYAVGEWARTWPLEYIFKSFGSYFIRRKFREPLYHTVLERYVQLITRNRVTQGIFPEGALSRDGTIQPAKIGLLDYLVGTLRDDAFAGDLWLVPVGINYDRVLEDRTLTRELQRVQRRPTRFRQAAGWLGFVGWNGLLLLTGQKQRYGRVAVNFDAPISVRAWLAAEAPGAVGLPRAERLPVIQRLADTVMARVGAIIPVTPVPFAAAALLSFHSSVVPLDALWDRMAELKDQLKDQNARIVRSELTVTETWDRAWRTFRARGLVHRQGDSLVILPSARPLLEYYANSLLHLLASKASWSLTPASGPDESLPRLGRQLR